MEQDGVSFLGQRLLEISCHRDKSVVVCEGAHRFSGDIGVCASWIYRQGLTRENSLERDLGWLELLEYQPYRTLTLNKID